LDNRSFDLLALRFGEALTRRRLGGLLAALGLGAGASVAETAAKKKGKKGNKKKKKCKNGAVKCGKTCVNTQTDDDHCGGCHNACGSGERCVAGDCTPSTCGPGQRDCGGGLCIEDDELACCIPTDCGGSFQDLECNQDTHRCECFQTRVVGPGWGICERFADGGGFCGPCCPGGIELGESCPAPENRDRICVSQGINGCQCPPSTPEACPTASMSGFCSIDLDSDPRRCGQECQNCTQLDPGTRCCSGFCVRGCGPNTSGSCLFEPCGNNCEVCPQGMMCCNLGPGFPGECVPAGTFCPLPR
jgi:hypothetical protein